MNTGQIPENVADVLQRVNIEVDGQMVRLSDLIPSHHGKRINELDAQELVDRLCTLLDDPETFKDHEHLTWGPSTPQGLVARVSALKMWYDKLTEHYDGFLDKMIALEDAWKAKDYVDMDEAAEALAKHFAYALKLRREKQAAAEAPAAGPTDEPAWATDNPVSETEWLPYKKKMREHPDFEDVDRSFTDIGDRVSKLETAFHKRLGIKPSPNDWLTIVCHVLGVRLDRQMAGIEQWAKENPDAPYPRSPGLAG